MDNPIVFRQNDGFEGSDEPVEKQAVESKRRAAKDSSGDKPGRRLNGRRKTKTSFAKSAFVMSSRTSVASRFMSTGTGMPC